MLYKNRYEFKANVPEKILEIGLRFNNIMDGVLTYTSDDPPDEESDPEIIVRCTMDRMGEMTFESWETLNTLLQTDNIQIYFNEVCQLWDCK